MKKRWLSIFLSTVMALTLVPAPLTALALTEFHDDLISVNSGKSTVAFDKTQDEHAVELWKAQSAAAGSQESIVLDYTFSVNADDILNAYNGSVENDDQKMGANQQNKRFFAFGFHLQVHGQSYNKEWDSYTSVDFELLDSRISTEYSYVDLTTDPENPIKNFNQWSQPSSQSSVLKFSSSGKTANLSVQCTVADLLKEIDEHGRYEVEQVKICSISLYADIYSNDYVSWWNDDFIGSVYTSFVDKHTREIDLQTPWDLTLDSKYYMRDYVYISEDSKLKESDFYTPVRYQYDWSYYLMHSYGSYNEEIDVYKEYGMPPEDFTGSVYKEVNPNNGKLYGFTQGSFTKTEPSISIREFITAENYDLIMNMVGLGSSDMYYEGRIYIEFPCRVTMTYADGMSLVLTFARPGDGMRRLHAPCVHTCGVCGGCTAEENLPCNSQNEYGMNDELVVKRYSDCTCATPQAPVVNELQLANSTVVVGSGEDAVTYQVAATGIQAPQSTTGTYLETIENIIPNNTINYVIEVSVQDEEGYPFDGTYDNQVVTVGLPISQQLGQGIENGTVGVVHINTHSNEAETFAPATTETEGTSGTYQIVKTAGEYVIEITSNSFSPIVFVNKTHTHTWSTEWTHNETHHWQNCTAENCDITADAEKRGYDEHNFMDGVCSVCGYQKPHEHAWTNTWEHNDTHHWHECTAERCTVTDNTQKDGYAAHHYDNDKDTTCNDCGAVRSVSAETPTTPQQPNEETPKPEPTPTPEDNGAPVGAIVGGVVGGVAAVAAGGFAVFWFKKKK